MRDQHSLTFAARLKSVKCALRGIWLLVKSEHNAWLHAAATLLVTTAGLLLGLSVGEWCWIVLAITSVWTAEALNTALETLTDLASPTIHPIARNAKDIAAGAVLLAALGAGIIGVLVFGPHLMRALD
ncbi:MAG: diacylglycerol kinase family protein [Planctomycetota bacterium]